MMACRPAFSSLPRAQRVLQAATFGNCCPQLAHAGPTGPVWCFAGVRFPTLVQKPHTGPHRAEFLFCSKNEFTPPPKGGGAGYRFSWVCRVCLTRLQPAHTAPTGPVWSLAGVVLLLSFQNRTQGHVGLSLVSTLFLPYSFALAGLICPTSHARKSGLSPETNGKITEVF